MTQAADVAIAAMQLGDIPQVMEIDRLCFPNPWSEPSYRYELLENRCAYFIVALQPAESLGRRWLWRLAGRPPAQRPLVGYAGLWLVVDEAHINTLAVRPQWRGRGIGERLLLDLLAHAQGRSAVSATLEVRVSNAAAQRLYRKHGFEEVGRRPRYYQDGEDALLMTVRLRAGPQG